MICSTVTGRPAQDIFDNALTGGVLGPCEAQGVSEVFGCARTEPPVLAGVILGAEGETECRCDIVVVAIASARSKI
eukprot:3221700-Prymnesium_polylepis.1